MSMNEANEIRLDRMRYIKNKESANLALLAIVLDVIYFVSIYKSDVANFYYTILIGASVVYNLLFMLGSFLASEGVKNYKAGYSWLLYGLGVLQIVRIFILPMQAHTTSVVLSGQEIIVMGDAQFYLCVALLVLSAVCLVASAVINQKKCGELSAHLKTLGQAA